EIPPELITEAQRYLAKILNFGCIYGISSSGFAQQAKWRHPSGELDVMRGQNFIDQYFRGVPAILRYMDTTKAFALDYGYVEDMFGRRRDIPEVFSINYSVVQSGLRESINHPIQSGASGVIKLAMAKVRRALDKAGIGHLVRVLIQIHDELLLEAREDVALRAAAIVKYLMETALFEVIPSFSCPIKSDVEIGPRWGSLEPVEVEAEAVL
ncbi:MAG: DNA polymerase A family protein, partial [Dehalococcoidia bacterium]|nr:DNA polymerase A family protein [Dehalococcoidia bacterium]